MLISNSGRIPLLHKQKSQGTNLGTFVCIKIINSLNYIIGKISWRKKIIMNKASKIIIRVVSFLTVFLLLFQSVSKIFIPKWLEDSKREPISKIIDGFYAQANHTIDVLYLGTSNTFYDINPLVIEENYDMAGYVLGSREQRLWTTAYYLREALKTQSPNIIVLDSLGFFYEENGEEEQNRKVFDYMKFGSDKLATVKREAVGDEEVLTYAFPFLRYHSRYGELTKEDFLYPVSDKQFQNRGYVYSNQTAKGLPEFDMNKVIHEGIQIGPRGSEAFDEIEELCKQHNITLILIKTPNIEWGIHEHNIVSEFARKRQIAFYDYNEFMHEIGIYETDSFHDGAHLNYIGAQRLSLHLGEILTGFKE